MEIDTIEFNLKVHVNQAALATLITVEFWLSECQFFETTVFLKDD